MLFAGALCCSLTQGLLESVAQDRLPMALLPRVYKIIRYEAAFCTKIG